MRFGTCLSAVLAIFALGTATQASAELISIDFNFDNGTSVTPTYSGAAIWGSSGDVWNGIVGKQLQGTTIAASNLVNSNGNPTSVGIDTGAKRTYGTSGGTAMDAATADLMVDYINIYTGDNPSDATISITGLPANTPVDLILYAAGDSPTQGANFAMAVANGGATTSTTGNSRQLSAGQGVAYNFLSGTTDGSGALSIAWSQVGTEAFSGLNGIQMQYVVPEPSSLALLLCGMGLIPALRRKRRA